MTFRPIGIQDKLTDAYFDTIELHVPRIPNSKRKLKKIHIRTDAGSECRHQEQSGRVKRRWKQL